MSCNTVEANHMTTNDAIGNAITQSADASTPHDHLLVALDALSHEIAGVRELIEKRLSDAEVSKRAFDRLYEELDRQKKHGAVLDNRPLYLDLILLADRLESFSGQASEATPALISLRDELREILFRRDIHLISRVDDTFDPRFQRAVLAEDVHAHGKADRVLRTLREGYICGDVVLRPQEVVVGRLATTPTTGLPPTTPDETS